MDPERRRRAEALFLEVADLDPAERERRIEAACADDPELASEVRRLLAGDAADDTPFESFRSSAWLARGDSWVGREVGAYRLTGLLGTGGMGVVYRAERVDGLFEREVAVKLIRAEHMGEASVRRFDRERRALAALEHPNIARLYDGGTTPEGTPFLVMELVEGEPIDASCDRRQLPLEGRLRLFATVCRAAHVAHQSLVVHRDLKPSNVLIDRRGEPKLLDFGIARLLDDAEAPLATDTGARALTPEYASPEQLSGAPVTTAIDVYALGVLLHELLTGRRPFEARSYGSPVAWQLAVLQRAPDRPSTVVRRALAGDAADPPIGELARRRATTPGTLRRRIHGDLDRIVLMALRKEPERRYGSAQALAEDVERYLAGRPILAREDSLAYQLSKFVGRNRVAVGAAALVLLAVAAAFVGTLRSERRTRQEALHARIEASSLESVAEFVMDTFLTSTMSTDPERREAALQRVLLHAERARKQHDAEDHLRANLLDALGRVALRIGAFDEAHALVREALAIRSAAFGEESLEYALSLRSLGLLEHASGRLDEAERFLERALELHRGLPQGTHTDVATLANDLAVVRRGLGDLGSAETLHLEALELRRASGPESLGVAESLNNLAGVHLDRGEHEEARALLAEALEIRRRVLTERHPLTLQSMANLAMPAWSTGGHEEAMELLEEAAAGLRLLRADGAEGLGRVLSSLAGMQIVSGQLEEAEATLGEALAHERARLGEDHPALAGSWAKLAELQQRRGRVDAARESWERALALREASGSPRAVADALFGFGRFLVATGDPEEGRAAFAEAVAVLRDEPDTEPLALGRAELALGACLSRLGRRDEAVPHLRAARELLADYPVAAEEWEEAGRRLEEELAARGDAGAAPR